MKIQMHRNLSPVSPAKLKNISSLLAISCFLFAPFAAHAVVSENYENKTAEEKQAEIWDNIIRTQTFSGDLPITEVSAWQTASLLNPCTLWDTFRYRSDEAKPDFVKRIHSDGSVAKVEWIPSTQTTFTGLFRTGGIGVLRASLADTHANTHLSKTYVPGFALKIFIDGEENRQIQDKASVNFIAMYSLAGQSSRNFFENSFSNVIDPPTGFLSFAAVGFDIVASQLGMENATTLSTYEGARTDRHGIAVDHPVAPYQVIYTPTSEVSQVIPAGGLLNKDMREQLGDSNFRDGVVLYTVTAVNKSGTRAIDLGKIVLRSGFIPSEYGDKVLFFKHQLPKLPGDPGRVL